MPKHPETWDWAASGSNDFWTQSSLVVQGCLLRWKEKGFTAFLDHCCGRGRHALCFAKHGFQVRAFDAALSGVQILEAEAVRLGLVIDSQASDMHQLPYPDDSVDCMVSYHGIYHSTYPGLIDCLREARRVLRPNGELFLTLNSQANAKFVIAEQEERVVDGRTVYKNEPGHPEEGVPHTYLNEYDVFDVAKQSGFRVAKLQHIEDIYVVNDQPKRGWHYYCIFA